jgi:hypothetical protein
MATNAGLHLELEWSGRQVSLVVRGDPMKAQGFLPKAFTLPPLSW